MRKYLGRGTLIKPIEFGIIIAVAISLSFVFDRINAFENVVVFLNDHESWQLDEYFFAFFFLGFGALIVAVRRGCELASEMRHREAAEQRALMLARHDPLTGLANRRVLHEELPALIDKAQAAGGQCAVFVIDLDHFKPVNDLHGHEAGDGVLVEVATRLNRACPDGLTARLGGDEFVAVMAHEAGTDAPARAATQIVRMLSAPYEIGGRKLEIGATIGIARAPIDSTNAEELLRSADVAMYDGKRAGKGVYRFFHAEMDERLRARARMEADLRAAIEAGEIIPHFQPVISLAENRIVGFEALARWHHPTKGMIQPDAFIPVAEDIGVIDALSNRILREGCIAARDWHPDTTLSINISPIQLKNPWLSARLLGILAETGFPPSRLIVEVTENAIIEDIAATAEVFGSLQNAGIRIALDDFGKGYSSLSHLRQLKFNHLKIDSSFIQTMDSIESQRIVKAVAGLGKALGMPVTAEGVETEAAAATLRALDCEQAQGYLFGKATSAEQAADLLNGERAAAPRPAGLQSVQKGAAG
ncbi:putative bifunctional diguanylate cyclase/phosphodiesterase [Sphingomonas sp. MMS12-HWE2-04]|uniref:putative bifunctional diguanylate cyclase/phosphodiesterase n=1 Tax=Sphingomonas sp. MMS12-HWE2-04 TaxID=3234199 RepID=UPI00384DE363